MEHFEGILKLSDLGPGVWVLKTSDGDYELVGDIPNDLQHQEVVVQGDFAGDVMGIGMTAPQGHINVDKIAVK